MQKRILLLATAASLTAGGALAQSGATSPAPTGANPQAAIQPAPLNAAPAKTEQTLSEVVVTALRSRTDLQKAAAAITVLDGQTLKQQRVEDIRGIQNLVPGIHINPDVTATQVFIRGAGSPVDFYWIPEQVAVNYDGVYLPRFEVLGAFYDIDNVQVLPGPQGVLYGHSASGGRHPDQIKFSCPPSRN